MTIQPEKYYEACITYHLVTYFENILDKKLYPFSISQIQEKDLGYDFGYEAIEFLFFIQFKRPLLNINSNKIYWKIESEQLSTINSQSSNFDTYYCLPNFTDSFDWYKADEKTFFVSSIKLSNLLKKSISDKKSVVLHSDKIKLDTWENLCKKFENQLNSALATTIAELPSIEEIKNYINNLDVNTKDSTWCYIIGGK